MAGEKKGKAYEAFVKLALESLKQKKAFLGSIFWDEKPEAMTIIPDLTIGTTKDELNIFLLITHSGAAGNSHMKTWRNMGELAEAKVCLPTIPQVFNIAFDSVIKENLKKAQAASFDGQLIVGDLDYGDELQGWIDQNLSRFPKEKEEKVKFLETESKSDKVLQGVLQRFTNDLQILIKRKAPAELDNMWQMERQRKRTTRVPPARNTFVRRGLSKLLIFEDIEIAMRLYGGKRVKNEDVPAYAYELELAGRAMGRAYPVDEEVQNAIATIAEPSARWISKAAPTEKLHPWLNELRNIGDLASLGDFILAKFDVLTDSTELLQSLKTLHDDPNALVYGSNLKGGPPQTVWLFEMLMEIVKASEEAANGYGYAQLAREVVSAGFGSPSDLSSPNQFGGGFGLSAWISRDAKSGLRSDLLAGCASVLARRLAAIGKNAVKDMMAEIKSRISNNIIESKLCTYKGFEPLRLLIENTLKGCKRQNIRSCFGERAELTGQATKTTVLQKGKTLINWQSCSDAGRDHKKKELCGRAVALRYSWDSKSKKFIPRPGIQKLILVVDGTWRQEDLEALARAGWDEIYYPDEMDKLAKTII
jgi:hypothetical protein